MQQLYSAVRAAGADNLVVAGGIDWAYDLSGVPGHSLQGQPFQGNIVRLHT
jgi:hypothetical protein